MRLPEHIYKAIKEPFAHHGPWHVARQPENGRLRGPGNAFPDLKSLDDAGSGEQFLRFHRDMVRMFKWFVENTPGPPFAFEPWDRLPSWLEEEFGTVPWPLSETYDDIDRLVKEGSADDLGNFIEPTNLDSRVGSGVHDSAHGFTHRYEVRTMGADNAALVDAGMNSFFTAPHNEHFWGLHGWIDSVFAEWQAQNGEDVDQSPLPFDAHTHMVVAVEIELTPEEKAWRFPTTPRWLH